MSVKLSQLLKLIPEAETALDLSLVVEGVTDDSRLVKPGFVFIALQGCVLDGAQFIEQAQEKGAIAIVSENNLNASELVKVSNTQRARELIVQAFYGTPAKKLSFVGITGTNGKTTISFLINQFLKRHGLRTALSGTIATEIAGQKNVSELTTPGFIKMQELCALAVQKKCRAMVMEVSSHALDQNRVLGIEYDVAVFTNLSQDHLDYHTDMEEYYGAKKKLFTQYMKNGGVGVINMDDEYGARLIKELPIPMIKYSRKNDLADLYFVRSMDQQGIKECTLSYRGREFAVCTSLFGQFNEENILAAVGAALAFGVPEGIMSNAIEQTVVPGRMELIPYKDKKRIFIDYAHTPDALERVLHDVRSLCKNQLRTVFGCGGDRDAGKRSLMGSAAEKEADVLYVTSDNPRTEEPLGIIADILTGIKSKNRVETISDRKEAIEKAIEDMDRGDCLVIAGKGHEDYQIIGTEKFPFDDKNVVRNVINNEAIRAENIRVS